MSEFRSLLSEALVAELERVVDERVRAALAELESSNGSPWLSVAAASDYLGVSPRTVTRLLEQGRLRSTCVGRRRLLHRDDLDAAAKGDA